MKKKQKYTKGNRALLQRAKNAWDIPLTGYRKKLDFEKKKKRREGKSKGKGFKKKGVRGTIIFQIRLSIWLEVVTTRKKVRERFAGRVKRSKEKGASRRTSFPVRWKMTVNG